MSFLCSYSCLLVDFKFCIHEYKFSLSDYQYVHMSAHRTVLFTFEHNDIDNRHTYKHLEEGKSQDKLQASNGASARPCLLNACCTMLPQGIHRDAHRHSFQVSRGLSASRHLSRRWLEACRGRWSLLCHPLIRIIKLSQPGAHKRGISPALPSCRASLQIASDLPPDCAMIMLSLDAVIMMAHNCWCALAAAQRPPISLSTCLRICRLLLCLLVLLFSPPCVTTLPRFLSLSSLIQTNAVIPVVKHFDVL